MTTNLKKPQKPKIKPLKSLENFTRYSSLAFEMIVFIFAGVFGGIKLDKLLNTTPLFTTVLSLIGVVLAVFFAIKDLIRQPKDGDTVK